jgi:hypothetical protein
LEARLKEREIEYDEQEEKRRRAATAGVGVHEGMAEGLGNAAEITR